MQYAPIYYGYAGGSGCTYLPLQDGRHYAQAYRIQEILRSMSFPGFNDDDIQLIDDFDDKLPERGIYVSMIEEGQGVGVNERNDVRYACRVVRVLPKIDMRDGMQPRSSYRESLMVRFHRQRIGIDSPDACEIVTSVRPDTMKIRPSWQRAKLDVSVMRITSLIREKRYSA
jgi:hypothetical protein